MALRLTSDALADLDDRIVLPRYDRDEVTVGIVHLGVGGFHRAHQAVVVDDILAAGDTSWGICGVGLLPGDSAMRDALRGQDTLYSLMTRSADGGQEVRVVGSIVEYLFAPEEPDAVLGRLTDPATRIVSLTITEGGYLQDHATGEFDPRAAEVVADLENPERPSGAFGYLVEALRIRRERGVAPFTVMSCDNIRGNGDVARAATVGYAMMRSLELAVWIEEHVAFPNSMVDRITPATSPEARALLREEYGLDDAWPVASEDFFQWVLEDRFTDGRPRYEIGGVQVVDDVLPFELMKLRLLNASHQVLAYVGSVAGYRLVHEAVADERIVALLRRFWETEAIPTLHPIPGVDFHAYSETLLARYSNPHVRDTLERLATDASNRIPVFVLPIVRDRLAAGHATPVGALTVAAWERYALGVDDHGGELTQHDARADELRRRAGVGGSGADGFLGIESVFGELRDDPAFVEHVDRARRALTAGTVLDAIDHLLTETLER